MHGYCSEKIDVGHSWGTLRATRATFFCPQGGHCGEVQPYLKIPWKNKIIMYIYMKLCSIFSCFFLFQAEKRTKICLEQGWSRSSGVH